MDREPLGLARAHSAYFLLGGLWPLIHFGSFEAVLGRKRDAWLVQTVALIITGLGASLAVSARRGRVPLEMRLAAAAAGVGMGGIAAVYGARGRISRLYLFDAAIELVFASLWIRSLAADRQALMASQRERPRRGHAHPAWPEPTRPAPQPPPRAREPMGAPPKASRERRESRSDATRAAAPSRGATRERSRTAEPPRAAGRSRPAEPSPSTAGSRPAGPSRPAGRSRPPTPAPPVGGRSRSAVPASTPVAADPQGAVGEPVAAAAAPSSAAGPSPAAVTEAVVVRVFFERSKAEAALEELLGSGYDDADVTLTASGGHALDQAEGSFRRGALELTVHPREGVKDPDEIMSRHGGRPRRERTTM